MDCLSIFFSYYFLNLTFQINFIREIPVFWGWSDNDLRVLYSSYTRRKCQQEEPVYIQGDKANSVYIVKQGTFRVSWFSLILRNPQFNMFLPYLTRYLSTLMSSEFANIMIKYSRNQWMMVRILLKTSENLNLKRIFR